MSAMEGLQEEVQKFAAMQGKGEAEDFLSSDVFEDASHDCYWKGLAKVLYLHLRGSQKREVSLCEDLNKKELKPLECEGPIEGGLLQNIQRIEKLLHLVLKDIPVCISYSDANLEYKYIKWLNSSATSMLICDDILEKRDSELVNVIPGALELMEIKKSVLSTGVAERREIEVSVGEVSWIVVVCEPYYVNDKVKGVLTLWIDETVQMAMKNKISVMNLQMEKWVNTEEELRRAMQYASLFLFCNLTWKICLSCLSLVDEAVKSQNEYFAVMSHEIRTPLTSVLGMAQILATTQLDAEQKEMVDNMVFSGDVLLSIISDVLDLSKMESGTMRLEEIEFDPRDIIKHVAKIAAISAKVRVATNVFSDVPKTVVGDPLKLQQALLNLVYNAKKFTEEGYILIKLGVVEGGERNHGASSKDGSACLRFAVEDTGIGIPEEAFASVFEKYTQVQTSSTRAHGGTGLGLAICKQLVERMGGTIDISSCIGEGSTFSFTVSCKISDFGHQESDETASVPAVPSTSETQATGPHRFDRSTVPKMHPKLLVVEDNKVNMMVAVSMLKRFGLTPDVALNGQEAINAIQVNHYDLVFMDMCMPVLDGLEATKRVRKFEKTGSWEEVREVKDFKQQPRLPVVTMTANAASEWEAQCKEAGMDGFMSKPISFKKMHDVLEKFLPGFASEV